MNSKYINIYNNLVTLTRNKKLYKDFDKQDVFSDRLVFFLLHFAFFLNIYKEDKNKDILQEIYDYIFRQLELSIREIGYGDQTINKKMKDYLNLFYSMVDKIHYWDKSSIESKSSIIVSYLNKNVETAFFIDYFEKYRSNLLNNTLNSHIKDVIKQ
jgi:cytochrome b pre-mRNA-processing protein 3